METTALRQIHEGKSRDVLKGARGACWEGREVPRRCHRNDKKVWRSGSGGSGGGHCLKGWQAWDFLGWAQGSP